MEIALPIVHMRVMTSFTALDLLKLCIQAKYIGGIENSGSN